MIPKTVSASSLGTADGCLARYHAENILFTPSESPSFAAKVGTACHYALEKYVEKVYMEKAAEPSLTLLLTYYHAGYIETFDMVETKTPEYRDGKKLLEKWFERTDLSDVQVLSVEKKTRYPIPTSAGDIPFTYIWDRCDFWVEPDGRRVIRIVDYKSIQANVSPDQLREKLQARVYDLMARIQFRDESIDEFQVVFDLLRHEPVGVVFSAEEAQDIWTGIIERVERILATDETKLPETLNPECGYCVRKVNCKALQRNASGGGIFSITDIATATEKRYELANQAKGIKSALEQLDALIISYSKEHDELSFDVDGGFKVSLTATKRRVVDSRAVALIVGPEIVAESAKIGVGDLDAILKDPRLTTEQVEKAKRAVGFSLSDPSVKITKK